MSDDGCVEKGSPFPESVKTEARRLASFRCCYCRDKQGDQVHHLIPQEGGGQGVLDNAILLCVQCHADYGHRPDKRRQLREARDHWYELVAKRHGPEALIQAERFDTLATKNDVGALMTRVDELTVMLKAGIATGTTTAPALANVASTMVNSISPQSVLGGFAPGAWVLGAWLGLCGHCSAKLPPQAAFCPSCGSQVGSST